MQAQRPEPTWSLAWQCIPVISALLWWAGRWTGESQEAWGLEYTLVNHEETLTQKDRSRGLTLENLISTCAMAHTCTQADYAEVYVLCLNGSMKGLVHDYAHKTAGRLWYGLCSACPLVPLFCRGSFNPGLWDFSWVFILELSAFSDKNLIANLTCFVGNTVSVTCPELLVNKCCYGY